MTRQRVLLIDDHDHVRFGLRRVLEGQGHAVEEADDGLDGVRKALAWRPDVVVADLDMPLLDGYGVARQIRQALGPSVRIVALSGRTDRERVLAAGFDAHFLKPADPDGIFHLVQGPTTSVTANDVGPGTA
jgi:CheY-like chemotaxis protein